MTPAEELRAAAAVLRTLSAAARAKTMTGNGDEWLPWTFVRDHVALPGGPSEPTGAAYVAHPRYAHNNEEAWEESEFITGAIPAPIAEWMALVSPVVAEPLAAWLERVAFSHGSLNLAADSVLGGLPEYAEADAILRRGPYDLDDALKVARSILGTDQIPLPLGDPS